MDDDSHPNMWIRGTEKEFDGRLSDRENTTAKDDVKSKQHERGGTA